MPGGANARNSPAASVVLAPIRRPSVSVADLDLDVAQRRAGRLVGDPAGEAVTRADAARARRPSRTRRWRG